MAAASLFSVGKTVLEKLGPLIQQEAALLWSLRAELEKLKGTMTAIQALLLDAEEKQEHSHQVRDWLEKLTVLLFDAEDLLDDVATEDLRSKAAAERDGGDDLNCKIHCWSVVCFLFISVPNCLIYGVKMTHKVKSLREQLDAIYGDNTKLHLNVHSEEKGKMRMHTHTISFIPDVVVGREDDVKQVKKLLQLTDNGGSSSSGGCGNVISVVPIVGMGGMGKTTLAQLIYNDRDIKEEFKLRMWVCVSDAFEVDLIVQKILESATGEKKQGLELNTLTDHLIGEISNKKYLLVLDDVWIFDTEKWDVLKSVLKRGASGSKIIVTTRFEEYARKMSCGSPPPYTLRGLSSPQSWSLLRKIVFGSEFEDEKQQSIIINSEEIKTEIMKKSAGVPLAVKTVANLLHFKDPQTEWLPFLRSSELLDARHNSSIGHNLKLSYDYLPSHLKQCFLYCCLYPKGYEICVPTLIRQWVVLGFIKSSQESLLDLGLQCFMDLSWRSFFQELKLDESSDIVSCKMHDLIHDLAASIGGSSYVQISGPTNKLRETTYHISMNHNLCSPSDVVDHLDKAKRIRTFLFSDQFCCQPGTSWEDSILDSFVSKFESLRLLDLPNLAMEVMPHHIQKLKHLRYFNLSFNQKMTRLPNSITMLQNLQVLNLYNCKNLQELPRDIRKLVNLWYLNCLRCFALTHMPMGLGKLTRLKILTSFVVGKDTSASKHVGGLDELNRLNNLRGELNLFNLRYLGGKMSLPLPSLAFEIGASANLKGKLHLGWLGLNWDDGNVDKEEGEWEECLQGSEEDGEWDESLLKGLEPHSNLNVLNVVGYKGRRTPGWISSLTNLVTFQLVGCKVRHGLHHLQGLPVLRILLLVTLMELEYMDEDVDEENAVNMASKPFFPHLEDLNIINCLKLKGWRRELPPQFPKLSKLFIKRCPLLTSVPLFPTLNEKLVLIDTSLQPLLHTMNYCNMPPSSSSSCSSTEVDDQYHPLSKLKSLHIGRISYPPKEWLQSMQHLTSLQDIVIENCAGLEYTLHWHNISRVPNVSIDGFHVNKDGEYLLDEDAWKSYFPLLLKKITKVVAENKARQGSN